MIKNANCTVIELEFKKSFFSRPLLKIRHAQHQSRPEFQQEVEGVLASLGVSADTVVARLYEYIREERRLPQQFHTSNVLTRETIERAEAGLDVIQCASVEDLYQQLGI
jgi:DNA-damage-inducible protein J